ncbi:hypothetical protein D9619_012230 [Psilocybe cf. subviscida]|uniref:Uncharacterized protein n=1 Tax=Psilocybe cf. subviscida TaxID=2480587 RepID=A0A8H5B7P5_9AGAR|nr:hypothetical protein D9619_012230 [Psilocybe cf. subviscida]
MPIVLFIKSVMSYLFMRRIFNDDGAIAFNWGIRTNRINRGLLKILTQTSGLSIWITILLVAFYVAARVGLLIQALGALRDLKPAETAFRQY